MPKTKRRSPNKEDADLGFKIRKRRQDMKFSLDYVAGEIGISKQQLRKYELGRNKISARRLAQIAPILGVTANDLINDKPLEKENHLSDIDIEARTLWLSISDPEHKRIIVSVMKMVVENTTM